MYIPLSLLHSDFENDAIHLKLMVQDAIRNMNESHRAGQLDLFEAIDTVLCINDFSEHYGHPIINLNSYDNRNPYELLSALEDYYSEHIYNIASKSYLHHFTKKKYEFTDEEYKNIQETINQLREDIQKSDIFGEDHQERLLKKLEALQKELHKKMNSLDKALGMMASVGMTLGQFGEDIKPLTDRVTEVFGMIRKAEDKGDEITPPENQIGYEGRISIEFKDESERQDT